MRTYLKTKFSFISRALCKTRKNQVQIKLVSHNGFWKLFKCLVCSLFMAVSITACLAVPADTVAADAASVVKDVQVEFGYYQVGEIEIHYAQSGDPSKPLVLFIHGTPGTWEAYARYMQNAELSQHAHLIAVDRVGFGKSANAGVEPSLQRQSVLLRPVLGINKSEAPAILVGHSLGGSIATRLAIDAADKVGGIVLIASSLDPELGKPRWYNKLASWVWVAWMLSDDLMLANREIMPLEQQLSAMVEHYDDLTIPVTVIHGERDKLVSVKNTEFVERFFVNADLTVNRISEAGHFILWKKPQMILDAILDFL